MFTLEKVSQDKVMPIKLNKGSIQVIVRSPCHLYKGVGCACVIKLSTIKQAIRLEFKLGHLKHEG